MTRLLILAYGRETEHQRAIFAVLSFWAWYAGGQAAMQTVVFTDRPDAFPSYLAGLPVEYELLTAVQLEAMRGPQQFVHRIKVAIIAQVFRDHPGDKVLFCDSDTFFVAESEQLLFQLQSGRSLMHAREYCLADAVNIYSAFNQSIYPQRFIELIENQTFQVGSSRIRFHKSQYSWNSGVLGITAENGRVMPDIMALTDAFYAGSGWFTSEQMAFSLALQTQSRVIPSNEYVFHYWGSRQKELMDRLLADLITPYFGKKTLHERLIQVRYLTKKWWRTIELDKDREGAIYAFSNGEVVAGIKCAAKAIFAAPFNAAFTRDLVAILSKMTRGVYVRP